MRGGYRKKADLIKWGIKFGRNMVRGKGITNSSRGNTFLIIRMYNKVLNGHSKPCYRICYQNNIMPNNCQCHIHFLFVPDSLLLEHLKLSCGIHSSSLNLNFDFLEIITSLSHTN